MHQLEPFGIEQLDQGNLPDDLASLQSRLDQTPEVLLLTLVRGRNAYFLPLE